MQCLDAVVEQMRTNKLCLIIGKVEALWVGGSCVQYKDYLLVLDGVALKKQVCRFGVLLDTSLSLEVQLSSVARIVFY